MRKILFFILLFISIQSLLSQEINYVNAKSLNIRKGPGKTYKVIDSAPLGSKVTVISENGKWSQIQLEDGTAGYVSTNFLTKNNSTNKKKGQSSTPVIAILILVGAFLMFKKGKSSSEKQHSSKTTKKEEVIKVPVSHKEKEEKHSIVYVCKFCGTKKQNLSFLTGSSCRKSSSGYHIPYEGKIDRKYQCKFCGVEKSNFFFLTDSTCRKSDNGYHQPFEGGFQNKYCCKYCGVAKINLSFLTDSSCRKSPNGYHQPMI